MIITFSHCKDSIFFTFPNSIVYYFALTEEFLNVRGQ